MNKISTPPHDLFASYHQLPNNYDEVFLSSGNCRPEVKHILDFFNKIDPKQFDHSHKKALDIFVKKGITFGFDADHHKHIFPFDLVPRVINSRDWTRIERGLKQRVNALNLFLHDIYHEQHILKDKIIPGEMILTAPNYISQLQNVSPAGDIYIHVAGIDIVRDTQGNYLVLEDNLRIPSGVSYALTNRYVMRKIFPEIMAKISIRPIDDYSSHLSSLLCSLADMDHHDIAVVLTPGPFNSAYFEHAYLAKKMGWPLVQGSDLVVRNNQVYLKNAKGEKCVRVIYKRLEDSFLDPNEFNKASLLGVPGIMRAYRDRNVVIANALGNGVADDKAIFAYVPQMIRYYLHEDPILQQVPTFLCADPKQRQHVLENMASFVVKRVDMSGGMGLIIGPQANQKQISEFKTQIKTDPRKYIAQPLIELSSYPTWNGKKMEPRRVDLRPYVILGKSSWVIPGGLSRVAPTKSSYIVNSCQGGGSKDTWIVDE